MNKGLVPGLGSGDAPDVLAGDAGQNALLVAGNRKEVSFSTTTAQIVAATDCSDYRWVSVHHVTQGTNSTIFFEASNDGVNWVSIQLAKGTNPQIIQANSVTAGTISVGPLGHRYFRLNITGISAGTTSGVVEFFAVSPGSAMIQPVHVSNAIAGSLGITDASAASAELLVGAKASGYNGATWDRLRVPTIVKTATATASGDTALWTPTSGKKFRLMRARIEITADAATSGGADIDIVLRDATTATAVAMSVFVPAVAGTGFGNSVSTGWMDLGNGLLSALANNVLNINLSATITSGKVRVVCAGVEE